MSTSKKLQIESTNSCDSIRIRFPGSEVIIKSVQITIPSEFKIEIDPFNGILNISTPYPDPQPKNPSNVALASNPTLPNTGEDADDEFDPEDEDEEDDDEIIVRRPRRSRQCEEEDDIQNTRHSSRIKKRPLRFSPDENTKSPKKTNTNLDTSEISESNLDDESDNSLDDQNAYDDWLAPDDPDQECRAPRDILPSIQIPKHQFEGVDIEKWFADKIWGSHWDTIIRDPYFIHKVWAPVEAMVNNMGHGSYVASNTSRNYFLWVLTRADTDVYYYRHYISEESHPKCDFCTYPKSVTRTWLFYENHELVYKMRIGIDCHLRFKAILRIFQDLWGCTHDKDGFYSVYGSRSMFNSASDALKKIKHRIFNAELICELVYKKYQFRDEHAKQNESDSSKPTKKRRVKLQRGDAGYDSWETDTCPDPENFKDAKIISKAPKHTLP